jgi:HlyD family secretion protein
VRRPGLTLTLAAALLLAGCRERSPHVLASGTIEMDEIDVGSLVGGRVRHMTVEEGDTVRAGDTLVWLDRGEIEAEVRVQEAQAGRAAAEALEVQHGPRSEQVRIARAELARAIAEATLAQRELARVQSLVVRDVLARAELDRAKAARDAAVARRRAAAANLRLLESGSRSEQIVAAGQAAEAARASVSGARSRLSELALVAPLSGVVLLKNFDVGELALPGQALLTLGNPDSLWIRVYVPSTEMDRVQLGAKAEIRLTGFGGRVFEGRVVQIASRAEFTPRVALTEEERANLVFAVKLALAPNGRTLKAGLPADVRIQATRRSARA